MARLIIDTRHCSGWRVIAKMAGACDLNVVALVISADVGNKSVKQIREELKRTSSVSKVSVVEIPRHAVDAVKVVRACVQSGDIIVTESFLLAFEVMRVSGKAVTNWGEQYTLNGIKEEFDIFYRNQELKRRGEIPFHPKSFGLKDRRNLKWTLEQLVFSASGVTPRKQANIEEQVTSEAYYEVVSTYELRAGARVFVDGDSCSVLPDIIETCGIAHVPVIYVCNRKINSLLDVVCKKDPYFLLFLQEVPQITIETVPMKKDAADKHICESISPGDIVVTDDIELTISCLNSGAIAIDNLGRICGLMESEVVTDKKFVRRRRQEFSIALRKQGKQCSFRYCFEMMLHLSN